MHRTVNLPMVAFNRVIVFAISYAEVWSKPVCDPFNRFVLCCDNQSITMARNCRQSTGSMDPVPDTDASAGDDTTIGLSYLRDRARKSIMEVGIMSFC